MINRRTPIKRGKPPKRTPLKQGQHRKPHPWKKNGRAGAAFDQAKDFYFVKWGSITHGPCQVCGLPLLRTEADPCHKTRRNQVKKLEATGDFMAIGRNLFAAHRKCHTWADHKPSRYQAFEKDPANMIDGGRLKLTPAQQISLTRWLLDNVDIHEGA